jgi:hypothetical protein
MKNYKLTILITLFIYLSGFSQEKFEKEYRVKPTDVPEISVNLIKSLNFKKKVKWYAEESNDGKTFEAKTCHQKHYYSIEFSENGTLIDLEKKVGFSELEEDLQSKIKNKLSEKYQKYKFKKIQIQYKGLESEVKKGILNLPRNEITARIFYEIIVKAKKDNSYALYELLLDENGTIIKELKFKASNSLNLEF